MRKETKSGKESAGTKEGEERIQQGAGHGGQTPLKGPEPGHMLPWEPDNLTAFEKPSQEGVLEPEEAHS